MRAKTDGSGQGQGENGAKEGGRARELWRCLPVFLHTSAAAGGQGCTQETEASQLSNSLSDLHLSFEVQQTVQSQIDSTPRCRGNLDTVIQTVFFSFKQMATLSLGLSIKTNI